MSKMRFLASISVLSYILCFFPLFFLSCQGHITIVTTQFKLLIMFKALKILDQGFLDVIFKISICFCPRSNEQISFLHVCQGRADGENERGFSVATPKLWNTCFDRLCRHPPDYYTCKDHLFPRIRLFDRKWEVQ